MMNFLDDILITPLSGLEVSMGYIMGGALRGFINGVLDGVLNQLKGDGLLKKSGRGLNE